MWCHSSIVQCTKVMNPHPEKPPTKNSYIEDDFVDYTLYMVFSTLHCCYPSGFTQKHTITSRRREGVKIERPKTTLTLPYIRGLSEAIRRVLTPLGVKVVFRPLRTLRQMLVRPKDPVPIEERKGVVYSIPCVECSSVYIGQTGRSLKQRISEHHRALENGDVQMSALAEHVFRTGHAVDLSQSEVLDHHQHTTTRCMLESRYI